MTRLLILAAVLGLALTTSGRAQDVTTINFYKGMVERGMGDYRGAAPKALEWLKSKDNDVAIASAELLGVIGTKLKESDEDDDKKLRLKSAKALMKAAIQKDREKLTKAATKAVDSFTTKKERDAITEQLKKEEEEEKKK